MKPRQLSHLSKNISIAIGIILVWRGVWILLDLLDQRLFGGNHAVTALIGIAVGIAILYIPDKDFRALERL